MARMLSGYSSKVGELILFVNKAYTNSSTTGTRLNRLNPSKQIKILTPAITCLISLESLLSFLFLSWSHKNVTKVITGLNTLPHAVQDCSVTSIERTHIEQPLYKLSSSLNTKSKNTKQTNFYNFISYISAELITHPFIH